MQHTQGSTHGTVWVLESAAQCSPLKVQCKEQPVSVLLRLTYMHIHVTQRLIQLVGQILVWLLLACDVGRSCVHPEALSVL